MWPGERDRVWLWAGPLLLAGIALAFDALNRQVEWTASYWWFLGMIIAFTAARLILVGVGVPQTRVRLFQQWTSRYPREVHGARPCCSDHRAVMHAGSGKERRPVE